MSSKDEDGRESYYSPTVEIKDYNVTVDGIKFFDQPIKNDFKTYERKIATLEKLQQVKVMITQLDVY